jgi:FAD/FMN-containing dehydrogenase
MERARAIYCSYDLHCNSADGDECVRVNNLFDKASDVLIAMGAFFDRPYGRWAQMVYSRTGTYTEYLKRIKRELDPNNIMNPGKLCF